MTISNDFLSRSGSGRWADELCRYLKETLTLRSAASVISSSREQTQEDFDAGQLSEKLYSDFAQISNYAKVNTLIEIKKSATSNVQFVERRRKEIQPSQ